MQADFDRIDGIADLSGLTAVIAHLLMTTGTPMLLIPFVSPDKKQSDLNAFQLYPGNLSLGNRDYYLNDAYAPVQAAFRTHVAEMLRQAGVGADEAADQSYTIFAIEAEMAAAMLSPVEAANPETSYNKMPVAEMKALAPRFDFDALFAQLNLTITGDVIVAQPQYVKAIEGLLAKRPLADFKSYLRWRLINGMSQYLSPAIAELELDFYMKKLRGMSKLLPRQQRIASQMQHEFGHPVAQLYVRQHFSADTRSQVEEMVGHIKAQFMARLQSNEWLSESTRAFAMDKLERMDIHVGYPDNWLDYSDVEIRRDDYMGNMMRLNAFSFARNLVQLGKPVVTDEFNVPGATLPTDINAAYQPTANKIEISAAILQPPFYYPHLDASVNYGAIGAVIGHEITHGFDSIGRRFDADGNMKEWWTAVDSEKFNTLTGKLVEQFNQYEVLPDLHVNGQLTVTENTADLGGVTLAWAALEQILHEQFHQIDSYTPQERFFIAWAQLWMSKTRPEVLKQLVSADPHTPSAFRVTGPLVNLDAFFETFNIQPEDGMWRDETERVQIW